MKEYYYLVSSLPYLKPYDEPVVNSEEFISQAFEWLSAEDYDILISADIDYPFYKKSFDVLNKWSSFEKNLRNAMVQYRAKLLNKEAAHYKKENEDIDISVESAVPEIVADESPFNAEKKLYELRWKYLDELEGCRNFDLGVVIIYYLKLQLLERFLKFNKEEGSKYFDGMVSANEQIEEPVKN